MYIDQLLNEYKSIKNYVQDKQIAHDLGISTQKLSDIRNGRRYLTENETIFLANEIGADIETVLVYLAADKAKSPAAQQAWKNITKKYEGLGLSGVSMSFTALAVTFFTYSKPLSECALCILC